MMANPLLDAKFHHGLKGTLVPVHWMDSVKPKKVPRPDYPKTVHRKKVKRNGRRR